MYDKESGEKDMTKRKTAVNRLMSVVILIGFLFLAYTVVDRAHLFEDPGTLEENATITPPEGYTVDEDRSGLNGLYLVRETDSARETLQVEFAGFEDYSDTGGEVTEIDEDTTANLHAYDWDHSRDNSMTCYVMHDEKCYEVGYQCQDTTRKSYYSSCSAKQKEDMIAFVRTFQYHEPKVSGNVFLRMFRSLGVAGCIFFAAAVVVFVGMPVAMALGGMGRSGEEEEPGKGNPVRSSDLHEEMNREREQQGESSLPPINTVHGVSTNNLARRDHTWSSVPDFFVKLFRGKK